MKPRMNTNQPGCAPPRREGAESGQRRSNGAGGRLELLQEDDAGQGNRTLPLLQIVRRRRIPGDLVVSLELIQVAVAGRIIDRNGLLAFERGEPPAPGCDRPASPTHTSSGVGLNL